MSRPNSQIIQAWNLPIGECVGASASLSLEGSTSQAWTQTLPSGYATGAILETGTRSGTVSASHSWSRADFPFIDSDTVVPGDTGKFIDPDGGAYGTRIYAMRIPYRSEQYASNPPGRPPVYANNGGFRGMVDYASTGPHIAVYSDPPLFAAAPGIFEPVLATSLYFQGALLGGASLTFYWFGSMEETVDITYAWDPAPDEPEGWEGDWPPPLPDDIHTTNYYGFTAGVDFALNGVTGAPAPIDPGYLERSACVYTLDGYPTSPTIVNPPGFAWPVTDYQEAIAVDPISMVGIGDITYTAIWENNTAPVDGKTYSDYTNSYTLDFTFTE